MSGRSLTEGVGNLGDIARDGLVGGVTGGIGYGVSEALSGGCSFTPETEVATANGEKPIGEIEVGDHVLAWNQATGATGTYTVTAVLVHADPTIVRLKVGGERITTTPEHPFYTQEHGWTPAGHLHSGEHVRKADGRAGVITTVEVERHPQVMYNLTVATAHTFFVGEQRWLVHNTCAQHEAAKAFNRVRRYVGQSKSYAAATSGKIAWSGFDQASDEVLDLSTKMGYDLPVDPIADQGVPGQAAAAHVEKKMAILHPDRPFAVSRTMCPECREWYSQLAFYRGQNQVVADPHNVWTFTGYGPPIQDPLSAY